MQNEWEKAIPWLEKGVVISMEHNIHDNVADFAAPLSTIYLKQDNLPLAKRYVEIAQHAAYKADALFEYYIVYDTLTSYYKQTGNNLLALRYLDSSIVFKDSLSKQKDINIKYQAEMEVEKEKIKGQETKLKAEKSRPVPPVMRLKINPISFKCLKNHRSFLRLHLYISIVISATVVDEILDFTFCDMRDKHSVILLMGRACCRQECSKITTTQWTERLIYYLPGYQD